MIKHKQESLKSRGQKNDSANTKVMLGDLSNCSDLSQVQLAFDSGWTLLAFNGLH